MRWKEAIQQASNGGMAFRIEGAVDHLATIWPADGIVFVDDEDLSTTCCLRIPLRWSISRAEKCTLSSPEGLMIFSHNFAGGWARRIAEARAYSLSAEIRNMLAYDSGYCAGKEAYSRNPNMDIRQLMQAAHSWATHQGYTGQDWNEAVESFINSYEDADSDC